MKVTHINNTYYERVIDAFVDYINRGLTSDGLNGFQESMYTVQKHTTINNQTKSNIQLYSQLLFATGGKLALHKCYVYVIHTVWRQGKRKYESTHKSMPNIEITQGFKQTTQNIKVISPNTPRKMLGAMTTPSGNLKAQKTTLLQKSKQWKTKFSTATYQPTKH